jgi:hypothetical protein
MPTPHQQTAVELTRGDDHLSIWVDANNNGVRDDDDVNIFITQSGGFYTESASFKATLNAHLRDRLKTAALMLMKSQPGSDPISEKQVCGLALQLIVQAQSGAQAEAAGTGEGYRMEDSPAFIHAAHPPQH